MQLSSVARLTQTLLYGKRFFPYYVYTIMGGLDAEGKGAVYSFDPVGSYEREQCRAGGAAASLIMPFLDNQVTISLFRDIDTLGQFQESIFGKWRATSGHKVTA
jgi:20S proteasome subunit beta 6